MKKGILIFVLLSFSCIMYGQTIPSTSTQGLDDPGRTYQVEEHTSKVLSYKVLNSKYYNEHLITVEKTSPNSVEWSLKKGGEFQISLVLRVDRDNIIIESPNNGLYKKWKVNPEGLTVGSGSQGSFDDNPYYPLLLESFMDVYYSGEMLFEFGDFSANYPTEGTNGISQITLGMGFGGTKRAACARGWNSIPEQLVEADLPNCEIVCQVACVKGEWLCAAAIVLLCRVP